MIRARGLDLAAAAAMAAYVAAVALAGIRNVHANALASSPAGVGRGDQMQPGGSTPDPHLREVLG